MPPWPRLRHQAGVPIAPRSPKGACEGTDAQPYRHPTIDGKEQRHKGGDRTKAEATEGETDAGVPLWPRQRQVETAGGAAGRPSAGLKRAARPRADRTPSPARCDLPSSVATAMRVGGHGNRRHGWPQLGCSAIPSPPGDRMDRRGDGRGLDGTTVCCACCAGRHLNSPCPSGTGCRRGQLTVLAAPHYWRASRRAFAAFRSAVSNPSLNRPYSGLRTATASAGRP